MPTQTQIDAVCVLHNEMYSAKLYQRYRRFLDATAEANVEGSVTADEYCALLMMRRVAAVKGITAVAMQKLAHLQKALHTVLLADGLGGSLDAAQRHVDAIEEELRQDEAEFPDWPETRRAFAEAMRRERPDIFEKKKMD
jgi:hypothetical protein